MLTNTFQFVPFQIFPMQEMIMAEDGSVLHCLIDLSLNLELSCNYKRGDLLALSGRARRSEQAFVQTLLSVVEATPPSIYVQQGVIFSMTATIAHHCLTSQTS